MKVSIKTIIESFFSKDAFKKIVKKCVYIIPSFIKYTLHFVAFVIVFANYFIIQLLNLLCRFPFSKILFSKILAFWINNINSFVDAVVAKLEREKQAEVSRSYLIFLAIQNLKNKAGRSFITILGMSVGVGIIVYLLSLGYGIERLVIGQIASLDELAMLDVSASKNTALRIDTKAIKRIKKIPNIKKVVPLISLVGRIEYNRAKTDVLVYAAPQEYLSVSKVSPIYGRFFSQKNNLKAAFSEEPEVAGVRKQLPLAKYMQKINESLTSFNILPDKLVPVWEDCNIESDVIGYTQRIEGNLEGQIVWGGKYSPYNELGMGALDKDKKIELGQWIVAKVPFFEKKTDGRIMPQLDEMGRHKWSIGCIQAKNIQRFENGLTYGQVLGTATGSAGLGSTSIASLSASLSSTGVDATGSAKPFYDVVVVATDSSGIELVQLSSSPAASLKAKSLENIISFPKRVSGEAIISSGLMNLLGLTPSKVLDAKFSVQFIIVKSLLPSVSGRVFTKPATYKIIGVVEDDENQYFYIPFTDMKILGIKNMSQLKIIVDDKDNLAKVRSDIESIGFTTTSVVDTVKEVEKLFSSVRIVLALIGLIALGVASLGMFNTLTVSLLERTREIGGMKTIGMVSNEILDLFLAEAMVMAFSGGIGGLFLGWIAGQVTSFIVSFIAFSRGGGFMALTYIPTKFILFIFVLSFIVGVVTGLYPARRARKISALDALRYE